MGTYLPGTGTLGWGAWCGAGTPHSREFFITPQNFYLPHMKWSSPFHVCAPPTHLDGCGFFISIVVRLPCSSISDYPKLKLFYILVVIFMGLCKEVSHVCLCCRLDWKSSEENFNEKVALIVSELDITSLENRALVLCIVKLHACLTNLS